MGILPQGPYEKEFLEPFFFSAMFSGIMSKGLVPILLYVGLEELLEPSDMFLTQKDMTKEEESRFLDISNLN